MEVFKCSVCGKIPKLRIEHLVSLKLYYMACKCGNKGFARASREDAAWEWNNKNENGA